MPNPSECASATRPATERDADSVCASFLLEHELFERGSDTRFEGEVSGVVGAGAFVRFGGALADVYEGFLPARRIGGRERYELDRTETMLVGDRGGGAIRIGDPVAVTVDRVEAPRGRVDLLPSRLMAKRSKAQRTPVSGDVATRPAGPAQVPGAGEHGGGHRAPGQRGEVTAGRQGADQRGLRGVDRGEVWLRGAHIPPYLPASGPEPRAGSSPQAPPPSARDRAPDRQDGRARFTLVPTRIYFKGPRAKVELALAKGKEGRDRRRQIADRDMRREVERDFKQRLS